MLAVALVLSAMTFTVKPAGSVPAAEGVDILIGEWKFHAGDDPAWAARDFDDSDWSSVRVPGSWQSQGLRGRNGRGWYRVKLMIGWQYRGRNLGLILGRIRNADEVYVNGTKIGGEGVVGDAFVTADDKMRVYQIPRELLWYSFLHYDKENVISVRVMNTYLSGGIVSGPVEIGDFDKLVLEAGEMDSNVKVFQGAIVGVLVIISLFSLFLYMNGFRSAVNIYFGAFILLGSIAIFMDSLIFYDSGLLTPRLQRLTFGLSGITALLFGQFVRVTLGLKPVFAEKIIAGSILMVPVALLLLLPARLEKWLLIAMLVLIGAVLVLSCVRCIRAVLAKAQDSISLLAATGIAIVGMAAVIFPIDVPPGVDPVTYSIPVMALPLLFAMARRYQDNTRRLHELSERIVGVQDIERARLARDLHDELGQSLAAIKLNLQMLERQFKADKPGLANVVDETHRATTALRNIVHDLRPVFNDADGLADMIKQHARRTARIVGRSIILEQTDSVSLPRRTVDQVFRIYQEALNNAIRHSQSERIEVSLVRDGDNLILEIQDEGVGFDPHERPSSGLGLLSMEERASLIGGTLRINRRGSGGTVVHLEVPIND